VSNLRDEVDALKKKLERDAKESAKANARSWTGRTQHDLTAFHKFAFQFLAACHWIWQKIIRPVSRFFWKPVPWIWHGYRVLWDKAVYYEDEHQNRLFSKTRAGAFLAASAAFAWYLAIPLLILLFDTGLYLATVKRHEVVYLTNSQEILPGENEHSVQGCHSLPCTDEISVYYRIRASNFNELWSVLHGRGLFYPDYVAASVPVSISRYTITSYGFRLKLLMRGFDLYPDLLETECTPLQKLETTEPDGP
jgi:hypothetical protein